MTVNENWAVSTARIHQFFSEQDDVSFDQGVYKFGNCAITLTPDTGSIGAISVSRTQVFMEGPDEQVEDIYNRFFLRFLSAGG